MTSTTQSKLNESTDSVIILSGSELEHRESDSGTDYEPEIKKRKLSPDNGCNSGSTFYEEDHSDIEEEPNEQEGEPEEVVKDNGDVKSSNGELKTDDTNESEESSHVNEVEEEPESDEPATQIILNEWNSAEAEESSRSPSPQNSENGEGDGGNEEEDYCDNLNEDNDEEENERDGSEGENENEEEEEENEDNDEEATDGGANSGSGHSSVQDEGSNDYIDSPMELPPTPSNPVLSYSGENSNPLLDSPRFDVIRSGGVEIVLDGDDSDFSDDSHILLPPSPRYRVRRNAIFMRIDPPAPDPNRNLDDDYFDNELEVATGSEPDENPIENPNSTSGGEDEAELTSGNAPLTQAALVQLVSNAAVSKDEEIAQNSDTNFGDIDAMDKGGRTQSQFSDFEESQHGLPRESDSSNKKRWICTVCKLSTLQNLRWCARCFKLRRNWHPGRPKSKKLKRKNQAKALWNVANNLTLRPLPRRRVGTGHRTTTTSTDEERQTPSNIRTPCESQPVENNLEVSHSQLQSSPRTPGTTPGTEEPPEENATVKEPSEIPVSELQDTNQTDSVSAHDPSTNAQDTLPPVSDPVDRQVCSEPILGMSSISPESQLNHRNSISQPVWSASTSSAENLIPTPQLCSICCVRKKNSAFVHNKTAHVVSCFTCADKILKKSGKCPICRDRALRVVRLIFP